MPLSSQYWRPTHPQLPRLFLAPMEGIGDALFRRAYLKVGGMDEMCTEFLRVPVNANVRSLAKKFIPHSPKYPIPLACQVMGQDPDLLTYMALALYLKGAPRIDLNCGCPSNTVVGRGAGSSLLKNPEHLYEIVKKMASCLPIPFSVKMRAGFDSSKLFFENLQAIEEGGADFITIHPRTKIQGYQGQADWSLTKAACKYVGIPVVGNGDIISLEGALEKIQHSSCKGLMIGRGALIKPWIFWSIKAHYLKLPPPNPLEMSTRFLNAYVQVMQEGQLPMKTQINKLKQWVNYLFQNTPLMQDDKKNLLSERYSCSNLFQQAILKKMQQHLPSEGILAL